MTLIAGSRLGPYEILGPLGAGGMGEVYRARDTRLGRDVAIKVLPKHLSASPEVRARFEREARTISSLNHPHICTLFDVGREGDTDYLVMELVEGESLAARLAKGALPADEVLEIGVQIADALDRAHRAGIIHRDLKPANVMLAKSAAKLMDFGLARAAGPGPETSAGGLTQATRSYSPGLSSPLTAEGSLVGTFLYMAPEQLEGKEADARSDLWALGCVLYEMATGRRAFQGGSQASLISSIMKDDPRAMAEAVPLTPPALERTVRQCLAKDPDRRWQSAGDLMRELRWIREGGSAPAPAAQAKERRAGRTWLAWTVAALGLAVAVASLPGLLSRFQRPRPVQLTLAPQEDLFLTPIWSNQAISPDGGSVASVAIEGGDPARIWLRPLDAAEATPLPGTEGAFGVFWSPDSRSIAFFDPAGDQLKKVSVSGGPPVTICEAKGGRGASWGSKGVIVLAPEPEGPLFSVSEGGGKPAPVTVLDAGRHEIAHRYPSFLPDGDHFLYASLPAGPEGWDIYAGSLGSRGVKKILTARSAATFVEPGYLLFVRDGKVMAQRFDPDRLELEGNPAALAEAPVTSDYDAEPVASASVDGRLVFPLFRQVNTHLEWLDISGAVTQTLSLPEGPWRMAALSPDARYAAVLNGDDVWKVDVARSVATRLTAGGGLYQDPTWSPDGKWIAVDVNRAGRGEIQLLDAGGGAARTLKTTDHLFKAAEDWTPDSRTLVFGGLDPANSWDIFMVPVTGDGKVVPLLRTPFQERNARVSPDGKWMLYVSWESGRGELYLRSFPDMGNKVQVSKDGADLGGWVRGGTEILYGKGGQILAVPVKLSGGEPVLGEPRLAVKMPVDVTGADLTPDGKRILASASSGEARGRALRVVLNWTGMLTP